MPLSAVSQPWICGALSFVSPNPLSATVPAPGLAYGNCLVPALDSWAAVLTGSSSESLVLLFGGQWKGKEVSMAQPRCLAHADSCSHCTSQSTLNKSGSARLPEKL